MRGRSRPPSRTGTPERDTPSPVQTPKQRLLEYLGLQEDSDAIERLPVDVLVATALECGLSARERALLVLGSRPGTQAPSAKDGSADAAIRSLTEQLSRQELRSLESWRKLYQQLHHRASKYAELTPEDLRKRHLELAKDEQLSPTESLLLYATLHATTEQRLLLAAIVCCESESSKMPMLNFSVAAQKGEAYLSQHGALLETLPVPLFPSSSEFDLLNGKLLREYDAYLANSTPSGGAPPNTAAFSTRSSVFRRQRVGNRADILGGGTLQVQQMSDSSYAVDTTQLEAAIRASFDEAFKAIQRLEGEIREINDLKLAKEAKEKKFQEFAPLVRAVRRAVINVQRSTQQGNGSRNTRTRRNPYGRGPASEEDESKNF
jgi:hypothetical protein